MKKNRLILCFSISILSIAACCLAIDKAPEMTVDMEKVKKDDFTKFITHVVWPSEEVIRAKRLDTELVKEDIDEFMGLLKRTLCAKYLPSDVQLKEVIACSELYNGDDYILLRYFPKDAVNISIQEGKALYVMITSGTAPITPLAKAEDFVKRTAIDFLNLPQNKAAQNIHVFVSSLDIGASKFGRLSWGPEEIPLKNWFGEIMWWTDGRSVLFGIVRKIRRETPEKFATRASAPPNAFSPRRFHLQKLIGDVPQQTTNQTAVGIQQIPGSGKTNDRGNAVNTGKPSKE
jgi:hypothetical protein